MFSCCLRRVGRKWRMPECKTPELRIIEFELNAWSLGWCDMWTKSTSSKHRVKCSQSGERSCSFALLWSVISAFVLPLFHTCGSRVNWRTLVRSNRKKMSHLGGSLLEVRLWHPVTFETKRDDQGELCTSLSTQGYLLFVASSRYRTLTTPEVSFCFSRLPCLYTLDNVLHVRSKSRIRSWFLRQSCATCGWTGQNAVESKSHCRHVSVTL